MNQELNVSEKTGGKRAAASVVDAATRAQGWFSVGQSVWWIDVVTGSTVKVSPAWHTEGWCVSATDADGKVDAFDVPSFGAAMAIARARRAQILSGGNP